VTTNLLDGAEWTCAAVAPGAAANPQEARALGTRWYPATVPGTAASAVRSAEGVAAALARDFDAEDWWFVTTFECEGAGPWTLTAHGLATVAEIWVDEQLMARSESMFTATTVRLTALGPRSTLAVRCAALGPLLGLRRRPRPRWRSALVREQGLRWWRTSLLGRAPLFTGTTAPVGPFRAIELCPQGRLTLVRKEVSTVLHGSRGVVQLSAWLRLRDTPTECVAEVSLGMSSTKVSLERDGEDFLLRADIEVVDAALWWPHTHGEQPLYPLTITVLGQRVDCGSVGFRDVQVDRSDNGFAISVNGVEIFCRGACWVPIDPVGLSSDPAAVRATLCFARAAGFNMVRITGTMLYEDAEFWRLCAELGVLVWQDAMLTTLAPPDDVQFTAQLTTEIEQLCASLQGNPALAVISGGSETEQQPALLGLAPEQREVTAVWQLIPSIVERLLPGTPYVSSSPSGGALPTHVGRGVAHYFGVGAYLRPISDVKTSGVRFAAECLAFAVPPERAAVERFFGSAAVAGHHPRWKAAVPRDNGASWDFEDVRDHYVHTFFGVDPPSVRRADPERYLDLGRAAICEAMAASMSYWRRDTRCGGALVLTLRDLEPGAGWGLLDSDGSPKAPYYVLRRLCQGVALTIGDEGLDGLRIDLHNDGPAELSGSLLVAAHTRSGDQAVLCDAPVAVAARSGASWSVDELAGTFLDLNHAHKFGPPTYDALSARLVDDGGNVITNSVALLGNPGRPLETDVGLAATASPLENGSWSLAVSARRTAQYVSIETDGYLPDDSWFHLAAESQHSVLLRPMNTGTEQRRPMGRVRAVNSAAAATVVSTR